LLKKYFYSYSI